MRREVKVSLTVALDWNENLNEQIICQSAEEMKSDSQPPTSSTISAMKDIICREAEVEPS
jgi:hypothetical protein